MERLRLLEYEPIYPMQRLKGNAPHRRMQSVGTVYERLTTAAY